MDKHSSLLRKSGNYGKKVLYHWPQVSMSLNFFHFIADEDTGLAKVFDPGKHF
jgi:hypothetical protein